MEPPKKKILLIDDNEIVRLMFTNIFWLHGMNDKYDINAVSSIEEGFVFIDNPSTRPDIIFTGLVMPFDKNGKKETSAEAGLSLIRRVKGDPSTKEIRVIIFSGYNEEGYREQTMSLGAEMYLQKNENMPQDILQIIRSFDTKTL